MIIVCLSLWATSFFFRQSLYQHLGSTVLCGAWQMSFWYYVIFPLLMFAVQSNKTTLSRLISALLALVICLILPRDLVLYGIIWLLGFGVVLLDRHVCAQANQKTVRAIATALTLLFVVALYSPRFISLNPIVHQFFIEISFSILLIFLTKVTTRGLVTSRVARVMAEFSYTLYLAHQPFLAVLATALLGNAKLRPCATAIVRQNRPR